MSLVLTLLTVIPTAKVNAFTYEDWNYEIVDGNVTITGYVGKETDLIIPSTLDGKMVTAIGDNAFSCHHSLMSITIPESVTFIGKMAFWGGESLKTIDVSENNKNFSSQDGILYNKDKSELLTYPSRKDNTNFKIPSSVKYIRNYAFSFSTSLIDITIPSSVISIGENAFGSCSGLASIIFPDSITFIGEYALAGCKNITSIVLPNNLKTIENHVFMGCYELINITIPDSVTSIKRGAFASCNSLENIIIPRSIKTIGTNAFNACNLTSIVIPSSVKYIGEGAFSSCNNLTVAKFMGAKPVGLSDDIFIYGNKNIKILYPLKHLSSWAGYNAYLKASHNDVEVSVSEIVVNKKTLTIQKGKKKQLKQTITPFDADNKEVTWSSSNKKVATVSKKGIVKAKNQGKCTITVTTKEGNKKAKCKVTVIQPITKIKLNKNKLSIKKGESYILKATKNPKNATTKKVLWSSSNKKIATVSKGKVKGIKKGKCYITVTAKFGGKKAKCRVTVK